MNPGKTRYSVTLVVNVDEENLRDAIAIARDHASVRSENIHVVSVMMTGANGLPEVVQWVEDA